MLNSFQLLLHGKEKSFTRFGCSLGLFLTSFHHHHLTNLNNLIELEQFLGLHQCLQRSAYKPQDRDACLPLCLTTRTKPGNADSGFLNDLFTKSSAALVNIVGIDFCFLSQVSFLNQGFLYRVVYCTTTNEQNGCYGCDARQGPPPGHSKASRDSMLALQNKEGQMQRLSSMCTMSELGSGSRPVC